MPMIRRRGPGLVGTAARTAVVAGTAGRVAHRQQQKFAAQQAAEAPPAAEPIPAASEQAAEPEYMSELRQLASLHQEGILTDAEFDAKKQEILGV